MLLKLILNALVIVGVWTVTDKGMIFWKPAKKLEDTIGEEATKPLFNCSICMSSFWGILYYFFGEQRNLKPIWHVISLAGLMKIVMTALGKQ